MVTQVPTYAPRPAFLRSEEGGVRGEGPLLLVSRTGLGLAFGAMAALRQCPKLVQRQQREKQGPEFLAQFGVIKRDLLSVSPAHSDSHGIPVGGAATELAE